MPDHTARCILVATAIADDTFVARVGATEAAHAAERCLNRIERAIAAHDGQLLLQQGFSRVASFAHCDAGALAASEMLERIRSLPNVSGLRQPARIGLHYGAVSADGSTGEGIDLARHVAELAQTEQALATASVVMALTPGALRACGAHALHDPALNGFEHPVFALGQRLEATSPHPAPSYHPLPRLRLRHQDSTLVIDDQRPVILLGRELGNDIVIMDPHASRQHARIERHDDSFILIDSSTNGTFVTLDGDTERRVHHDKLLLRGTGQIGCGFAADKAEGDRVFFEMA